jgi:hypothetical protein
MKQPGEWVTPADKELDVSFQNFDWRKFKELLKILQFQNT